MPGNSTEVTPALLQAVRKPRRSRVIGLESSGGGNLHLVYGIITCECDQEGCSLSCREAVGGDGLQRPETEIYVIGTRQGGFQFRVARLEGVDAAGDGLAAANEGLDHRPIEENPQDGTRPRKGRQGEADIAAADGVAGNVDGDFPRLDL